VADLTARMNRSCAVAETSTHVLSDPGRFQGRDSSRRAIVSNASDSFVSPCVPGVAVDSLTVGMGAQKNTGVTAATGCALPR
jgi:hypothetical protein